MAAKHYIFSIIYFLVLGLGNDCVGQTGLITGDTVRYETAIRDLVISIARGELGVREKTNHNDHPRIVVYHQSVSNWLANLRPAQPYCASFVNYCMKKAGVKLTGIPNPARARDWFRDKTRIVLTQKSLRGNQRMIKLPKKGSVVGYIFYGGAISHIEILDRVDLVEGYIYCIGANTSNRNSSNTVEREGQGVFYVRRKIQMFYQIVDVI